MSLMNHIRAAADQLAKMSLFALKVYDVVIVVDGYIWFSESPSIMVAFGHFLCGLAIGWGN